MLVMQFRGKHVVAIPKKTNQSLNMDFHCDIIEKRSVILVMMMMVVMLVMMMVVM